MVQKQFRNISNWEEWKELWDKNDTVEVAIGLLHASPAVVFENLSKGLGLCDEPGHEAVRFYLQTARLLDSNIFERRKVGEKTYQILVGVLDEQWDALLPDDELTQEVVDFFAEGNRFFNERPYREKAGVIVQNIWRLVKVGRCNWIESPPSKVRAIKVSRQQIARALVNAELFDFILKEEVIEAIPVLKEWLSPMIEWKLKVKKLGLPDKSSFPSYDQATIAAALDNTQSWVIKFALRDNQAWNPTRTLLELMIRRDVPSLPGVIT